MILHFEAAGSVGPNRGTTVRYRLGGVSVVTRSSETSVGEKSTFAVSLLIFLRKKEAMTVLGVW
jgi:hypothetical protein